MTNIYEFVRFYKNKSGVYVQTNDINNRLFDLGTFIRNFERLKLT